MRSSKRTTTPFTTLFRYACILFLLLQACIPGAPSGQGLPCESKLDCANEHHCVLGLCQASEKGSLEQKAEPQPSETTFEPRPQEATPEPPFHEKNPDKDASTTDNSADLESNNSDTQPRESEPATELIPETTKDTRQCTPSTQRPCFTGAPKHRGTGICSEGLQTCLPTGTWSPCVGEGSPEPEVCDNKDNDCNGKIDEALTKPCANANTGCTEIKGSYTCKGTCRAGTQTCAAGKWSACRGEIKPTPELCNNKDDNCNGLIDDNIRMECYTGTTGCTKVSTGYTCKAPCRTGIQTCNKGVLSACTGQVLPPAELCNGKDDNCDGKVDERWPNKNTPCSVGKGACKRTGVYICNAQSNGIICNATPGSASAEVCNNIDDDCDGYTDENISRSCYTASTGCVLIGNQYNCIAPCKPGKQNCSRGVFGTCIGQITPKTEECNNKDDNCNGLIDEGIPPTICFTNVTGFCVKGTNVCTLGKWSCTRTANYINCQNDNDCRICGISFKCSNKYCL